MLRAVVRRLRSPAALTAGLAGLLLLGLLVGIEPVGGDPDRLYRPLKVELARFLAQGRLPFWSDRLGLGLPLLAESHIAALYPLNWLFYGLLSVSAGYRLAMWFHYVFLALTTYSYARFLRNSPQGAALAAIGFTFCGFQAIHSSHEPFYQALPYLPLALLLAEWYLASGRFLALVLLACAWGMQLTLGHFQLQGWTAGLVLVLGCWRASAAGRRWRRLPGLAVALAWGGALAAIQLQTSWELTRFLEFTHRSFSDLAFYSMPPAHWAELAIPTFLRGLPGGPEGPYWLSQGSTGYESCLYIGTIPIFLALLALGGARDRPLVPWFLFSVAAVLLAMLPRIWPAAYAGVTQLPGLGWFRAPGRYTLITSLGLCLAAGRGLDRVAADGPGSFRRGAALAWIFALAAGGWAFYWASGNGFRAGLGGPRLALSLGLAALCWLTATALILSWRWRKTGASWLVLATAVELGALYYTSTTVWGIAVPLPDQSAVLARLSHEQNVGRVAGLVANLPVWDGVAPILPYTGFAPLPPHSYFEFVKQRQGAFTAGNLALLRRYGVSHGIWDGPADAKGIEPILETKDPALDRLLIKSPGSPVHPLWRLVRYPAPFPAARAALRVRTAPRESTLLAGVSFDSDPSTVWFLGDAQPEPLSGERATSAEVASWDGTAAVVNHNGSCDLVITRTYYPGWFASVNDGPEQPVVRAEAGIQAVRLTGSGNSRVRFIYRPTNLPTALGVSLGAVAAVGLALIAEAIRQLRARKSVRSEARLR